MLGVYTMDDYNNGANITHNSRYVSSYQGYLKTLFADVCTDRLTEIASFITGIGDQTLVFIDSFLCALTTKLKGTNWMVANEWWKGER